MRALLKIKLTAFYFNLIKLSFFSLGVSAGLSYLLKSLLTPDRWIYLGTDVLLTASFTMIAGTYLFGKDDLTRFIAAYKKGNETAA